MHSRFLQRIAEFISILFLLIQGHVLCDGGFNAQCINSEAKALVHFKEGLKDPSNRLSSWAIGKDCCQWEGVGCNSTTGHVISLDLHCANFFDKLQGELSPSLLELPYLSSLNLSGNDFMQSFVPSFLGTMKNLKHLDLSNARFKGELPDNLGNLSQLESVDLSGNDYSLEVNSLKWLHGLSSLRKLDLSGVALSSNTNDWFLDISMLPSLVSLRLSCCQLHILPQSPPNKMDLDSLKTLDLSFNYFSKTIPDWLFENFHHLQHLNLSHNQLQGPIPDSIGKLMSLVTLDLSNNALNGSIPSTLGQAHGQNRTATNSCLKELHLSNNQLNGSLERSLDQLSKLVVLDLSGNNLEGNVTDAHLDNFNSLRVLDLSDNRVTLNVSENWVPPFQLETIGLGNCQLGPEFPKWIQTQKNFSYIDISNASISDAVPDWFWDLSPSIEHMNLSSNNLTRCGLDFSRKFKLHTLDLSYNDFSCPLPHLPPNTRALSLATNSFHGTISRICEILGVNNSLVDLDLSSNDFSGNILDCWTHGKNMVILNLAKNSFSGSIPYSIGGLTNLHILRVGENNLSGKIPDTMKNCQQLTLIDLGSNGFWGPIPSWIGVEMRILKILSLSRNSFGYNIPKTLCLLKSLFVLDLSENQLTGVIPSCIFPAMATTESINEISYMEYQTIKGYLQLYQLKIYLQLHYLKMNSLFILLDLSSNLLTGDIPMEITMNADLQLLNLSRNQLVGSIPYHIGILEDLVFLDLSSNQLVDSIPCDIGKLEDLVALDLSRNMLSCAIPTSMVNLTLLSVLDLSYNNLFGQIPTGKQFNTFANDSYEGNPHLCGLPLAEKCPRNNSFELQDMRCRGFEEHESEANREELVEMSSFYKSMVIGFFTAYGLFWGSLFFISSWRYAYFRFLSNANDRIYVTVAIALAKLRRKFQNQQETPVAIY